MFAVNELDESFFTIGIVLFDLVVLILTFDESVTHSSIADDMSVRLFLVSCNLM
jgi:hypothetical protein